MAEEIKETREPNLAAILGVVAVILVVGGVGMSLVGAKKKSSPTTIQPQSNGPNAKNTTRQGQLPATSAEQNAAQTTTDMSSSEPAKIATPSKNDCYNAGPALLLRKTPATRLEWALDAGRKALEYDIYVSVAGEGNKYLLYVATPEREALLRQTFAEVGASADAQAGLCSSGFAEVQFIVRDTAMNQHLIGRVRPDITETARFIMQRAGGTPMQ